MNPVPSKIYLLFDTTGRASTGRSATWCSFSPVALAYCCCGYLLICSDCYNLKINITLGVSRPGKQHWEKRYVVLKDNSVQILEREQSGQGGVVLDSFGLCPPQGGSVSVHSAVTAAELTNTSSADLPYIFRYFDINPDINTHRLCYKKYLFMNPMIFSCTNYMYMYMG